MAMKNWSAPLDNWQMSFSIEFCAHLAMHLMLYMLPAG